MTFRSIRTREKISVITAVNTKFTNDYQTSAVITFTFFKGYLYAIKHGAKFIYDTDDDNAPARDLLDYFIFDEFKHGLVYDCQYSSRIMNPYAHFGQPMIWPRGYPLSEIHKIHHNQYICGKRKTSTVQQGNLIFGSIFLRRICNLRVKSSNIFEI